MYKKYRALRESGLVVFNRRVLASILGVSYASTNPILHRLVAKGILLHLKRDCYVLADRVGETRKIANELVKPSCISLWTALSDAGLTTQVPRVIQSTTIKRPCMIEKAGLPTFQYVHFPEKLSFGFAPDAEGIFRAEPEKALLDILFVQRGSIDWESLDLTKFNRTLLEAYAKRFPPRVSRSLPTSLAPS